MYDKYISKKYSSAIKLFNPNTLYVNQTFFNKRENY